MPTQRLTAEIITAAIEGFESQKRRIDAQIAELRQLLSTDRTERASQSGAPTPKRKISAAGRRRMAAAQQARWARVRGQSELPAAPSALKPAKQKRKMSEAGRKAISEATKRRWAVKRADAQKPQAAVAKKAAKKKTAPGKRPQKQARIPAATTPAAQ
jgi:hypothetical protein